MPSLNTAVQRIPSYLTKKISEETGLESGVVNLSRGQAGFQPPPVVFAEAARLMDPRDSALFKYEKIAGSEELRQTLSQWYQKCFSVRVDAGRIFVTDGGTGGISTALQVLTNPGDELIIPDPAYPQYVAYTEHILENRQTRRINLGIEKLTAEKLDRAISAKTKAVLLTSPNNPTGAVYDENDLKDLLSVAANRDIFIICDENHFPEVYDGRKHVPLTAFDKEGRYVVTIGSLSRLGLQGLRIGWAVIPASIGDLFARVQSLFNLSVNVPGQRLACFVLKNYDRLGYDHRFREYQQKRNFMIDRLKELEGFDCHLPQGCCYAFPNISEFCARHRTQIEEIVVQESRHRGRPESEIEFALQHDSVLVYKILLYRAKVGVLPGLVYGPASDGHIRLSFSIPMNEIEKAMTRLQGLDRFLNG
jgi:aspartate aminotransferase